MHDVTIILQGPTNNKISKNINRGIRKIKEYCKFGNVILSTWKTNEIKPTKKYLSKNNIEIIESNEDLYKNMYRDANMNFQVASTLNALKKVRTKFAIKLRTDEFYSDLSEFIKKIENNPNKIVTNNVFFSKNDYEPFHPSDHVIGGTTENMVKKFGYAFNACNKFGGIKQVRSDVFGIPEWRNRDGNNKVSPEVFLCLCYLKSIGVDVKLEDSVEIMKEHYDVVPLDKMGKFECKYDISTISNINYGEYLSSMPQNFIRSMEEL